MMDDNDNIFDNCKLNLTMMESVYNHCTKWCTSLFITMRLLPYNYAHTLKVHCIVFVINKFMFNL